MKKKNKDNKKYRSLNEHICEACGGDGWLILSDSYRGQVTASAKCIYCNGTGIRTLKKEQDND